MSDPTASAERAKAQIMLHEKNIAEIRGQLRSLGPPDENAPANSLGVAWLQTEGLPEAAQPALKIQLSSPVEEKELNQIFNPSAGEGAENTTQIVFHAVDTSTSTLTVSVVDADIPLGSSISYDLSTIIAVDNASGNPVEVELPVAILPANAQEGDVVTEPVCTLTLRLSFQPSVKDQRDQLYEKLNVETRQKAAAVEELRQVALAASRQQMQQGVVQKPPAVSSGFLNSRSLEKPKGMVAKMTQWYNRTLGPDSLLRRTFPIAKNYLIFFGAVGLFHFRGQHLALPPPM
ncbi:hypothetical protein FisN_7Lh134 [Fistulifera solaris]|uniref:Uncharacterized protein n=1 Tax=Fistulifera solaris TaxID=1519565 RepID=A0A1Z5JCN9_FISSO|nr:hypothetical protein FisN_7Lh134 [Fistulifera solaris]|eukprot:GAX11755.1 hypothetical protein FisN_7Lh134 [Fistulifera solaris]